MFGNSHSCRSFTFVMAKKRSKKPVFKKGKSGRRLCVKCGATWSPKHTCICKCRFCGGLCAPKTTICVMCNNSQQDQLHNSSMFQDETAPQNHDTVQTPNAAETDNFDNGLVHSKVQKNISNSNKIIIFQTILLLSYFIKITLIVF